MDIEIAKKAHEILTRLDRLNDIYVKLTKSDHACMTFTEDQIPLITLDCKKDGLNGEIIEYVLCGVETEIRDLRKILNDL